MANTVAILDEDGDELFDTINHLSLSVAPSKTFAKHTLENAQVVSDDQFDNPTGISIQIILDPSDYADVYKEIKSYYEAITNFSIQTRVDTYYNMYLEQLPHEETPEMFNTIAMTLEFTEQLITESDTSTISTDDTDNDSDVSSTDSGEKSTEEDSDGSILSRMFSNSETQVSS